MDIPNRVASRAEGLEMARTEAVQDGFREDASGGIPSAEEKDVVARGGHVFNRSWGSGKGEGGATGGPIRKGTIIVPEDE